MYDNGDILLFALSNWSTTSWFAFKKCFDTVHQRHRARVQCEQDENATTLRWRVLRILNCLGHIDWQFNSNAINVVASPPVLAALPSFGIRKAVLCGARSPETVRNLQEAVALTGATITVHSLSKSSAYSPTRVEVQAECGSHIETAAASLGINYSNLPSARWIAEFSASLQQYCQGLSWSRGEDLSWYQEDFDTDLLRFRQRKANSSEPQLIRYQSPVNFAWRYRLWHDGQFADIDLDWGRYAILAMRSRQVLRYDQDSRNVFVPSGTPLPVLLARTLGLCSGYAPEFKALESPLSPAYVQQYTVFRDVPPSIFRMVRDKIEETII